MTLLRIQDIGIGGDGIARLEDGRTVFIPFTTGGDVVEADIYEEEDGQARGRVRAILEKSPERQEAPCRHFGICGGCSLQHLGARAYHDFKVGQVKTLLEKEGVVLPGNVDATFIPPGTRRRANFAARMVKGKAVVGFHERKSAQIRDVPDCLIINEEVRRVMEGFRRFIPDIAPDGRKIDIMVQCAQGQAEIGLTGQLAPGWEVQQALSDALCALGLARISHRARDYEIFKVLLQEKPYYVRFGKLGLNLAPCAFLQPSTEGEQVLTDAVLQGVSDASCVADLFCGNGTFTGPLMDGRHVVAADFAPDAIAALQKAGVQAHLRNLFKDSLARNELDKFDAVVLDPPRAGASAQCRELSASSVGTVVYVSCNPSTFARDAQTLMNGGYGLSRLRIVDQFVWSTHVELAAVFVKS